MTSVGTGLFTEDYWTRSLEVTDALRAQAPVHRATLANQVRVWVIGRHEHARAALADPRLSKDAAGLNTIIRRQLADAGESTELSAMFSPHMLFSEGTSHTRLRRLVAAKFTATRIQRLRPRVEQVTAELLDALPMHHPADLVEHFAFPLPLTVICELLGVPDTERSSLREWTAALMDDLPARVLPASRAMTRYFTGLVAAKRAEPGEDLLSALVQVSADEDRLTDDELMGTLFLLFVAGHETATNAISNAVRWLLADPSRWTALGRDPELVPAAVEETLRYDGPVRHATHRYTTEPVEYGGVLIPAGEVVLVSLLSANRDPERFGPRAHEFDPGRDARGHLAFGHGVHYCLGASLGRMEAVVALTQITQRFPHASLAVAEHGLHRQRSAIMGGHLELPVLLTGPTSR